MRWWEEQKLTALQRKWYERLKLAGFNDLEDAKLSKNYPKPWQPEDYYRLYGGDAFMGRANYYDRAGKFLHEYGFKNGTEEKIWERHCEGATIREIAYEFRLVVAGSSGSVHSIITRLAETMKTWEFEIE